MWFLVGQVGNFFEIALSDIQSIPVSKKREKSRVKRLSLPEGFQRFKQTDAWY